jgi:hypothetical protein
MSPLHNVPNEIRSVEAEHPWFLLVYALAFVAAAAASAMWPWGVAQ